MAKNFSSESKARPVKRQQASPGPASDLTSSSGGETAKQFVKRHLARGDVGHQARRHQPNGCETVKQFVWRHRADFDLGPHRGHYRLKRVLERRGFVVKTLQKQDFDIWSLSLRPGTVPDAWDYKAVRRQVSTALREVGLRCPPSEVGVVITGEVLAVSFIWEKSQPGILTFWSGGKNQGTRTCWIAIQQTEFN
jgi:hypothetical protein